MSVYRFHGLHGLVTSTVHSRLVADIHWEMGACMSLPSAAVRLKDERLRLTNESKIEKTTTKNTKTNTERTERRP